MDIKIIQLVLTITGLLIILALIIGSTWGTLYDIFKFFKKRERFIFEEYSDIIEKIIISVCQKIGILRHSERYKSLSLYLDSDRRDSELENKMEEKLIEIIKPRITQVKTNVGIKSKISYRYYIDLRGALTNSDILQLLGDILVLFIRKIIKQKSFTFDYVAVHRNGSSILGYHVSHAFNVPLILINSESRWLLNDQKIFLECESDLDNSKSNKKVIIVDDSCSGGAILLDCVQKLLIKEFVVEDIFILFNRKEDEAEKRLQEYNVNLHSVLELSDHDIEEIYKNHSVAIQTEPVDKPEAVGIYDKIPFRLKRLNLYVNLTCPLRCKHCCVGPKLNHKQMSKEECLKYIDLAVHDGVVPEELLILGGEPTTYPFIKEVIDYARSKKFDNIGVCSSGIYSEKITPLTSNLNFMAISLDGFSKDSHDKIRFDGAFEKVIYNIKALKENNIYIKIFFTTNALNIREIDSGLTLLEDIGVDEINFHVISENGFAKINQELLINPIQWYETRSYLEKRKSKIRLKYPLRYVTQTEFDEIKKQGYKCMLSNINRLNIIPGGKCYSCCLYLDTELGVGNILDGNFTFNDLSEESIYKSYSEYSCPATQVLNSYPKEEKLIPICVHYKKYTN